MKRQLFDLTCRDERIFFSPYCWRTRMALQHKDLAFESLPWHFTEKDRLEKAGGNGRVPVLVDGDTWIDDSWQIAVYLDKTYPDRPPLMKDRAAAATAKFVDAWCTTTVLPTLRPICVKDVFEIIADKDRSYFRESREKMLGIPLEKLSQDASAERAAFNTSLAPMEAMLNETAFLGGDRPAYADYVLFGTLMWPHTVCPQSPLTAGTRVAAWFDRVLDLHDGYARAAATRAEEQANPAPSPAT